MIVSTFDNTINHISKTTEVILQSLIKVKITSYFKWVKKHSFQRTA